MPMRLAFPWQRMARAVAATTVAAVAAFALVSSQAGPGVHPISGRQYAWPMGVAGAPWLDRDEREAEEGPTRAMQMMSVVAGSTVADIGAGSGYFTERLARLVGPAGK